MFSMRRILKNGTACALVAVLVLAAGTARTTGSAGATASGEVRALWVTRATLTSPEAVRAMVQAASAGGFNTLLVQVRGRGDAYYASTLEPRASELAARPDFDPLAETLTRAREAGLRVHAWVNLNFVSSAATLPASREHIVYRQPEWLMVPKDLAIELASIDTRSPEYVGRLARWSRARATDVEGLYISPLQPAVGAHLTAVVTEIAANYAVDGVHFDYARYPNQQFDYSRAALDLFKQAVAGDLEPDVRADADAREILDPFAYPNLFPDRWDAFRRARMTSLVMRLRSAVKAVRPSALVSAAVVPDVHDAFAVRLQDWRTWLDQGMVDVLCPMAYTQDPAIFEAQVADAHALAGTRPVWAGIGAYRLSRPQTVQHVDAARRVGVAGIILFSYDALVSPPNTAASLAELGQAMFPSGSGSRQ
jgi:uncharacterized lipoprotein YddW (UPF0748 family)